MPVEAHPVIEQFVVAFPWLAAWAIVILLGTLGVLIAWLGRKFLKRMDTQDESLGKIESLLASEIGKLRENIFEVDRRVARLEGGLPRRPGDAYGRRSGDDLMGES